GQRLSHPTAACPLPLQAVIEVHLTLSPLSAGFWSTLQTWPVLRAPPRSWHFYVLRSLLCSPVRSAVSGHLLCTMSHVGLWSSPVLCPQSLVISCTMSAISGHLLYCVRSLWSSPVLCRQSLVISCTVSAVSGHLLYCVRSLWSSPVVQWSPPYSQSLVISCTVSAVSGHLLYCVRS
ncbi:unnamed protein product, partial [Staurois parvus]